MGYDCLRDGEYQQSALPVIFLAAGSSRNRPQSLAEVNMKLPSRPVALVAQNGFEMSLDQCSNESG